MVKILVYLSTTTVYKQLWNNLSFLIQFLSLQFLPVSYEKSFQSHIAIIHITDVSPGFTVLRDIVLNGKLRYLWSDMITYSGCSMIHRGMGVYIERLWVFLSSGDI